MIIKHTELEVLMSETHKLEIFVAFFRAGYVPPKLKTLGY